MKKYLVLALAVVAFGAVSCEKCQTCTTTVTQEVAGITTNVSTTSQEYCGDEYDDAPADAAVVQSVGGVDQTVTILCADN
ncbi:MAG: hypothetical protein HRT57_16320 [Crocinitomicaceae bacterium]|nr:hypothetical protein [Crocinitomicaceae bacterium]